jgi:hypothetical protein
MRGLVYFARTGCVPDSIRQALRRQARSLANPTGRKPPGCCSTPSPAAAPPAPHRRQLRRRLRPDRPRRRRPGRPLATTRNPEPPAGRDPLKPVALARRDEVTRAVTLVMDAQVAEAAVHAITADAMKREAASARPALRPCELSTSSLIQASR